MYIDFVEIQYSFLPHVIQNVYPLYDFNNPIFMPKLPTKNVFPSQKYKRVGRYVYLLLFNNIF